MSGVRAGCAGEVAVSGADFVKQFPTGESDVVSAAREPPEFVPGSVVEVAADDPADDLHAGERGTVLVRDPNDDLHILWDSGDINIWTVPDARASLRVIPS